MKLKRWAGGWVNTEAVHGGLEKTTGKQAADTLKDTHTSSACSLWWHQRMLFALAIASERFF